MVIQIDQELCNGCGTCMEACVHGAIQLWDQRAVIDQALCKLCEACMEICPNQAIRVVALPVNRSPSVAVPSNEIQIVPAGNRSIITKMRDSKSNLVPLAGVALMYLGREVVPKLVDTLISGLERRLIEPATISSSGSPTASPRYASQRKGKARRIRNRRRLNYHRDHRGRR
jgi:NAD-dependent dihydropyrimidine dehydrogenase PreA subunit